MVLAGRVKQPAWKEIVKILMSMTARLLLYPSLSSHQGRCVHWQCKNDLRLWVVEMVEWLSHNDCVSQARW
jgi:hypothetical protein